jgi:hypothetical protein
VSVSVAAIHPPATIYREEQNFGWWLYALMALMVLVGGFFAFGPPRLVDNAAPANARGFAFPIGLSIGLFVPPILVVGVLRMTTEVTLGTVDLWFGWVATYRKTIEISRITRLEVIQYRPLRDYGGWGIRWGRDGERVFNARGDRGVRLYFADGSRVLIGSQRPESLALAIEQAMRPVL